MKRTMPGPIDDGVSLASDLERARRDFHKLLTAVEDDEWTKPTRETRWTNEQLLFHMVFGYMVVQRLLILYGCSRTSPTGSAAGSQRSSTRLHSHSM
jgi:hypothetical protein